LGLNDRIERLRQRLAEEQLDGLLVSQAENCRYLSGFTGSPVALLVSSGSAVLGADSINFQQAKLEVTGIDVRLVRTRVEGLAELVGVEDIGRLGFEANTLAFSEVQRLTVQAEGLDIQLVPTEAMVETLRAVKENEEIPFLREAARLADEAVQFALDTLHPGMSERQAAWAIERFLRENGSEALPFEVIVASGRNSALPHARPTERPIGEREPVVLDLGARKGGYASDLSRTLCFGPQPKTFKRLYSIVREAQEAALDGVRPGMTGEEVDGIARQVIEEAGYGDAFGHRLGHGVGLDVHEQPRLGPRATDVLAEGMVFTIEPGIYIPGWGGIRIEDTVMLTATRAEALTTSAK